MTTITQNFQAPKTQIYNKVLLTCLFEENIQGTGHRPYKCVDPEKYIDTLATISCPVECIGLPNQQIKPCTDVEYTTDKQYGKKDIQSDLIMYKFALTTALNLPNAEDIMIIQRPVRTCEKDPSKKKVSYHLIVNNRRISHSTLKFVLQKANLLNNKPFDGQIYGNGRGLHPIFSKYKRSGEVPQLVPYTILDGVVDISEPKDIAAYCASYIEEGFEDLDAKFAHMMPNPVVKPETEENADNDDSNDEYKNICLDELICHLNQERANGYDSWMNGMWAIMNCCDAKGIKQKGAYELCDKFSSRCESAYDENEVYSWFNKNYDRRRDCGYRFKFLLDWLKEDDPAYYRKTFTPKKKALTYDQQKEEFESTDCKIKYPPMIVHKNKDGSFEMLTIKQAKDTYSHLVYKSVDVNKKGEEVETEKKFITKWMDDPNLRLYDKYMFTPPPLKCADEYMNTWRDLDIFKVPYEQDDTVLQRFNDYCINLLGKEVSDYIIAYFANRLQNPAKRNMVCIIIYGEEGDGKNRFFDIFKNIFGTLYFQELECAKQLFDTHSCFEKEKLFICVNEAKGKDTHENSEKLKARVTTTTVTVNPKGIQAFTMDNYCDYLMTTNNHNAVNIHDKSRRYLFCESSRHYTQNPDFFRPFSEEIVDNPKALRVIAEYLLNYDVSKIIPSGNFQNHIPKTDIMKTVIEYNRDKLLLFLTEYLIKKSIKEFITVSEGFVTSDDIFIWWTNWAEATKSDIRYSKIQFTTKLGLLIKNQNLKGIIDTAKNTEGTKRGYKINVHKLEEYVKATLAES